MLERMTSKNGWEKKQKMIEKNGCNKILEEWLERMLESITYKNGLEKMTGKMIEKNDCHGYNNCKE